MALRFIERSLQLSSQLSKRKRLLNIHKRHYRVLGIESSCDDTGAAIVDSDRNILGESLHSQQQFHLDMGGIIPTVAFNFHKKNIDRIVNETLDQSKLTVSDIDAIAVTTKPGMEMSLRVGLEHAKRLAKQYGKPLVPIHHMEAHALVIRLLENVDYPFLVLLISGGHCQLALVQSVTEFLLLGSSNDTSPGEMLDKIARKLKLKNIPAYSRLSGGRAIELLAKAGNHEAYPVTQMLSKYSDCNFAFSGMKSYFFKIIEAEEELHNISADEIIPTAADVCASIQYAMTQALVRRVLRAMTFCRRLEFLPEECNSLVVAGGVASNQYIRKGLELLCNEKEYQLFCPPPRLCTDNGVMIAWNGLERFSCGLPQPEIDGIDVQTKCPLGKDISYDVRSQSIKAKFKLPHDEIMKILETAN